MTSPREKAVAVLGHQAGCPQGARLEHFGREEGIALPSCVCDYPLHVLLAADRGRLRKEHDAE